MRTSLAHLIWLILLPAASFGQIQITSITATNSTCSNNGTVTVQISGGTPSYCYQINGGSCQFSNSKSYTFTGLFSGQQTITVTDGNSTATKTVVVGGNYQVPALLVNVNGCSLAAVASKGQPPYQYAISLGGGPFSSLQSSPTFNGVSGSYCIRVYDVCNNFTQFCGSLSTSPLNFKADCCPASGGGSDQICVEITDSEGRKPGAPGFFCGGTPPYQFTANSGGNQVTTADGKFQLSANCTGWTFTLTDACGATFSQTASCISANLKCVNCTDGTAKLEITGGVAPLEYYFSTSAGGSFQPNPAGLNNPDFSGLPPGGPYFLQAKDACGDTSKTLNAKCLGATGIYDCGTSTVSIGAQTNFYPVNITCQSCDPPVSKNVGTGFLAGFPDGVGIGKDTFLVTDACGATKILICQTLQPDMEFRRTCNSLQAWFQSIYQCSGAKTPINISTGVTYSIALASQPAQILQTNATGLFLNLTPGETYTIVASHPNCGSATRNIKMYSDNYFTLNYELVPTSFLENNICKKSYELKTWITPTPEMQPFYQLSGGNFVQLAADKFTNLQAGNYQMNVQNFCTVKDFNLPEYPAQIDIQFPDCPNASCLKLTGATSEPDWTSWGTSKSLKVKSKASFYILDCPDFGGPQCISSWDGNICNLLPGSSHTVYLKPGTATCPVDTATFIFDLSGKAHLDSVRFTATAACSAGSLASLEVQVFGGKDPLFLEVIDSLTGQVLATVFDGNGDHKIQVPNLLGGKNYQMRVVDDCGSSTDVTSFITLLPDVEAHFQFKCPDQIRLNTAGLFGANYVWKDPAGQTISSGLNKWTHDWFTATSSTAGNYSVEITYGSCPVHVATIAVPEFPPTDVAFPFADTLVCSASNFELQPILGNGNFKFLWSTGDSTETLNVSQSGTYQLIVSNQSNCADTANVSVNLSPQINVAISKTDISCGGQANGSLAIENSNAAMLNFLWENGTSDTLRQNLPPGNYSLTVTDSWQCSKVFDLQIDEPTNLDFSFLKENVTCFGAANGSILATPTGGTGPFQFLWNDGDTTFSRQNLTPGIYQATVTDANGCETLAVETIAQPDSLAAILEIKNADCFGTATGNILAKPTGGTEPYFFDWSNGNQNAATDPVSAGIFDLKITDANGCTAQFSAEIEQPELLQADFLTKNINCHGDATGEISATPTGGTLPFSFIWNNGSTAAEPKNLPTGDYFLTLTDGLGCTFLKNTTLTEPPLLTVSAAAKNADCHKSATGEIAATANGGTPPLVFQWSNGQNLGAVISNLTAGIYSFVVTDSVGCLASGETTVGEPTQFVASVSFSEIPCFGGTSQVEITASGGISPYFGTLNFATPAAQFFKILTDKNGCSDTLDFEIIQPEKLEIQSITTKNAGCFGEKNGSVELVFSGGTAPFLANWTGGFLGEKIENLPAGNYGVTVTDAKNCLASGETTLTESPNLTISATATDALCNASPTGTALATAAGGTPPLAFLWSNGQNSGANISNLVATNYRVTVTDALGCTASASAIVGQSEPLVGSFVFSEIPCFGGLSQVEITATGGTPPYFGVENFDTHAAQFLKILKDQKGCTDTLDFEILQPQKLEIQSITATDAGCFQEKNGSVEVNFSGGTVPFSMNWTGGFSGKKIENLPAGNYQVVLTDSKNCTASASAEVKEFPEIFVEISAQNLSCFESGDGVLIFETVDGGAGQPYFFEIKLDSTKNSVAAGTVLKNLNAGNYQFTVSDKVGCTASFSEILTEPPFFKIELPTEISIELGDEIILQPQIFGQPADPISWKWTPESDFLNCDSCRSTLARPFFTQTFLVNAEDANGCSDTATVKISVDKKCPFFVPNVISAGATSGQNDHVIFQAAPCVEEVLRFAIFDRWGELVFEKRNFQPNDPAAAWDGFSRGKAANFGVFTWIAEYRIVDGQRVFVGGDVTVLRE